MAKIMVIKGKDLKVGMHVMLDNDSFARVTEIVKAPMRLKDTETGKVEIPKWAYLAGAGHTTVCRDDDITVRA